MSDDDVTAAELDEALAAGDIDEAAHRHLMRVVEKREARERRAKTLKRDRWDQARAAADEDLEQGRIGPEGHTLRLREIHDAEKRHGRIQAVIGVVICVAIAFIVLIIFGQLQQAGY